MEENVWFVSGDRQFKKDLTAALIFVVVAAATVATFYSSTSALCCTEGALRFICNDQIEREKQNDITTLII